MRAIPPQEKVFAYYYASLFVFSIALSQLRSADVVVFLQLFLKGLFCLLGLNSEKNGIDYLTLDTLKVMMPATNQVYKTSS
jgi:hypothetical protein